MNVNQAFDKYLSKMRRDRLVTMQTIYTYKVTYLSYLKKTFGEKNVEDIHQKVIQDFMNELLQGGFLSLDSIYLIENVLNRLFDYLVGHSEFGVTENPCDGLDLPKREQQKVRFLSLEDQKEVEQAIYNHGQRNTYGILLSLYAGLRVAEVISLKWSDLDLKNCKVHVNRHISKYFDKEGKQKEVEVPYREYDSLKRTIPISSAFRDILKKIEPLDGVDYVFYTLGKRISLRNFQSMIHKFLIDTCRVAYPISEFRNTYGARLLQYGCSPDKVAVVMGFSKSSTVFHNFGFVKTFENITNTGMYRLP